MTPEEHHEFMSRVAFLRQRDNFFGALVAIILLFDILLVVALYLDIGRFFGFAKGFSITFAMVMMFVTLRWIMVRLYDGRWGITHLLLFGGFCLLAGGAVIYSTTWIAHHGQTIASIGGVIIILLVLGAVLGVASLALWLLYAVARWIFRSLTFFVMALFAR